MIVNIIEFQSQYATSLLGAQQHTTVETAAAIEMQDNKKDNFKAHIQNDKGQYRTEIYNI